MRLTLCAIKTGVGNRTNKYIPCTDYKEVTCIGKVLKLKCIHVHVSMYSSANVHFYTCMLI